MNSMLLDSPAVSDGLSAWENWSLQLEQMKGSFPYEHAIDSEIKRAKKVIFILTKYPQGLSADHPDFKSVVREISQMK
jgi:hypothetical protein